MPSIPESKAMIKVLGLFFLSVAVMTGCGYTTGVVLPSHYHTIFVKPVENGIDYMNQEERKIYIPGIETKVRTSLINRFLLDGNLRVGTDVAADLVLESRLLSFEREELRLTESDDVREYRLRVTVAMKMTDQTDDGKVLWEEPSFAGEATYYTTGPLAKSESTAIEESIKDLAQRAIARTVEDW